MCTPDKDSPWTRYLTMGVDADGQLHHILARRGQAPDGIVKTTLEINTRKKFDKLYVLEVGPEGYYGGYCHLKLQEIVPPPRRGWMLVPAKGAFS